MHIKRGMCARIETELSVNYVHIFFYVIVMFRKKHSLSHSSPVVCTQFANVSIRAPFER